MKHADFLKLIEDVSEQVELGASSFGILGSTAVALRLRAELCRDGILASAPPIYGARDMPASAVDVLPFSALSGVEHDVLIVADDDDKEVILLAALSHLVGTPRVIVAGYGHLDYRGDGFRDDLAQLVTPSIANGYPNTLVHLHQCLENAARLGIAGAIAEFGTFKGGTALFLARTARRLGQDWAVYTFDTFNGFPGRRSALDMYDHPDCVFTDEAAVRRGFEGWDIRLVTGDIVETAESLAGVPIVLGFVDTDNYTSATAALSAIAENVVVGGAIVFDHFTGVDRFRYTLGERIAAKSLLEDSRYFNLHGTGVFIRQR